MNHISEIIPKTATYARFKKVGFIEIIKLKEPYWSAGTKFKKWHYADPVGLSVPAHILSRDQDLLIAVGENGKWGEYAIASKEAKRITKEGLFFYKTPDKTMLAVIPRQACSVAGSSFQKSTAR